MGRRDGTYGAEKVLAHPCERTGMFLSFSGGFLLFIDAILFVVDSSLSIQKQPTVVTKVGVVKCNMTRPTEVSPQATALDCLAE